MEVTANKKKFISDLYIAIFLNRSKIPALLISADNTGDIWYNDIFADTFSYNAPYSPPMEQFFISQLKFTEDITRKFLHNPSNSELATFVNGKKWHIRKDHLETHSLYLITFIDSSLFIPDNEANVSFFFNNIPLPCVMFDFASGNIEAVNKSLASLISIPIEHILTMHIVDLLHGNKQVLEPYLKSEKPYQNSFLLSFYSVYYNSTFILEALPIVHLDTSNENSYKVIFMLSDISNTISEERDLVKQQLSYNFITKAMTDAVLIVQDGVIKSVNTAACNIWQYDQDDILGKDISDLIPDIKKISKSATASMGTINFTSIRRNGEIFNGQFSLKSIDDYDSKTFIYIIIDLTDKNIAGQIKLLNKKSAENLLNTFPNMLAIIDNNGKIINSNQVFLDFFGCSTIEDFHNITDNISTLFLPGSKVTLPKWFDTAAEKNNSLIIIKDKNGEDSFFTINSTFIHDASSSHYIISFTDVTSIYSTTRVLEDAKKRLESINDEMQEHLAVNSKMLLEYQKLSTIGTMITFITHQWKQPLNAVGLISQNLYDIFNEEDTYDKETVLKMSKDIIDQVFFMSETIENFNFFMKPQVTTKPFNAVSSIKNILTLLTPVLNKNRIQIETVFEESSNEVELEGFSNHMKQVIMNIISNAKDAILEYRMKNDEEHEGLVTLKTYIENNKFCIYITDNGTGLTPEQIKKIFSKNYSTKGAGGMGIGMYITETIITNMNGSITISSRKNENDPKSHGAVINIKIPYLS